MLFVTEAESGGNMGQDNKARRECSSRPEGYEGKVLLLRWWTRTQVCQLYVVLLWCAQLTWLVHLLRHRSIN